MASNVPGVLAEVPLARRGTRVGLIKARTLPLFLH